MPIQPLQRFIYVNFVKVPPANPKFSSFVNTANRFLGRTGIPRCPSDLTLNKAMMFASKNPAEILKARKALLVSDIDRYQWAVRTYDSGILEKSGIDPLKMTDTREELITAALEKGLAPKQMVDFFGVITSVAVYPAVAVAALSALPAILARKVSPSEISTFYAQIIQKSIYSQKKSILLKEPVWKDQAIENFGKLRTLLERGKSLEEILDSLPTFMSAIISDFYGQNP